MKITVRTYTLETFDAMGNEIEITIKSTSPQETTLDLIKRVLYEKNIVTGGSSTTHDNFTINISKLNNVELLDESNV